MLYFNKRAISPLIATILLVVVAVAIIAIVVSWGKGFTNNSLSSVSTVPLYTESETAFYVNLSNGINGRFQVTYNPPKDSPYQTFTITGYGLLSDLTNIVPLEPAVTITAGETTNLDIGIIQDRLDLVLYLSNSRMIIKEDLKQTIKQPTSCPTGYIPVPGNHMYGTMNSDGGFCVAKYEMKMDVNGDGLGNLVSDYPDCNTGSLTYNTYSYETCPTPGTLVSTKEGSPVTMISQTEAIAACENIGGHLITNNEWMTIVRNIEQVPSNWSTGIIGQGYIYSGHNDLNPAGALEASIDTNVYAGTGQTTGNQRRTLTLTNGEVIWDLAGNVWQWTSDTIQRKDQPDGFNNADDINFTTGWEYFDYSKGGGVTQYISSDNLGNTTLKYKDLFLFTSGDYNASTNGIGRIYTYSDRNDTNTTVYAFLRGGNWSNSSYVGVLSLTLSASPSTRYRHVGLLCVK